jgi:CBS domain-containing protein
MHTTLSTLLQNKGSKVYTVSPTATVLDAVRAMNEKRIGALLVCDDDRVVGIFTERDVLNRVVDPGEDPGAIRVADVMTGDVVTLGPEVSVEEAMAVVTEKRCRHLPVMAGEQLLGLISIGDLTRWVATRQAHHIQDLVNYITGRYPA